MNIITFKVSNSFIKNQCYLIYQNGEGVLVDPAWNYKLINDYIHINEIALLGILLTHSHIDHTDLSTQFSEEYSCPVFMSEIEIKFYNFQCPNLTPIYNLKTFNIHEFRILPILTPGHTKGGISYLIQGNLFTGDTFFIEGVGICDTPVSYTHLTLPTTPYV